MTDLQRVLMQRDGLTEAEALERIEEMQTDMLEAESLEDIEDILFEEGLEPDYFDDLF